MDLEVVEQLLGGRLGVAAPRKSLGFCRDRPCPCWAHLTSRPPGFKAAFQQAKLIVRVDRQGKSEVAVVEVGDQLMLDQVAQGLA